ncbi:MAG: hypothetical protein WBA93_09040 [Microcoleaceae cyanobacterium]
MKKYNQFWENNVKSLFTPKAINFRRRNRFGRIIRYVNLDNTATTTPLAGVKQYVDDMLDSYGSVNLGAGQKSQISTQKFLLMVLNIIYLTIPRIG